MVEGGEDSYPDGGQALSSGNAVPGPAGRGSAGKGSPKANERAVRGVARGAGVFRRGGWDWEGAAGVYKTCLPFSVFFGDDGIGSSNRSR